MPTHDLIEKLVVSSADGTSIYAMAIGDPANDALIFVHGYSLGALAFDGLFREPGGLLENFYLVAYDLRGHARSGKPTTPEAYHSSMLAGDFDSVLKAFDVQKAIVVPWSLGGVVAADIYAYLPAGTVSGIAYINAVPYGGVQVGTNGSKQRLPGLITADDVTVAAASRALFVDGCFAHPDKIPAQLKWSWIGATFAQPLAQDTTKLLEAARNGLPTLLISSTADEHIDPVKVEEVLKKDFKNLEIYKIENGGHSPFIENKEVFVEVLTKFAKKVFGEST